MSSRFLSTRNLILVAMFVALIAISGQIAIPFLVVPITLQTLVVMLAGSILGRHLGALSTIVFILLVMAGAPILAGAQGGLGALLGPTGGYVWSWPIATYVIGVLVHREQPKLWRLILAHTVGGVCIVYLFGAIWLSVSLDLRWKETLLTGVLPFIPGDMVKVFVAAIVARSVLKVYPSIGGRTVVSR